MGTPVLVLIDASTRKRIGAGSRVYWSQSGVPEWYWADPARRDAELDPEDHPAVALNNYGATTVSRKDSPAYPAVAGTIYGSIYPQTFSGCTASTRANRVLTLAGWDSATDDNFASKLYRSVAQRRAFSYPNEWAVGLVYGYSWFQGFSATPCTAEVTGYMSGRSESPKVLVIDALGLDPSGDLALGGMRAFRSGTVAAEYDGTSDLTGAVEDAIDYIAGNWPAP